MRIVSPELFVTRGYTGSSQLLGSSEQLMGDLYPLRICQPLESNSVPCKLMGRAEPQFQPGWRPAPMQTAEPALGSPAEGTLSWRDHQWLQGYGRKLATYQTHCQETLVRIEPSIAQCHGTMVSARMTGMSSCLGTLVLIMGVPRFSMQIL